ncbi:MAG: xanthine dehydrogenase family protein subunit M [Anaerolineales bacterium]|nr:xanthine dehydrogenase family protein subunit M [Anaerolineales bacterium]
MKPSPFTYHAPESLEAALALKAEYGDDAKFLAGGQSLIPAMNFRATQPERLIDVNGLRELDFVKTEGAELRLGALTRVRRLEREAAVKQWSPLLAETVPHIAHPQIRNRGTVGGSLAHADPAAELPVILLALNGRVRAQSASGSRWLSADDFFITLFTTALQTDEMLAEVALPQLPARTGTAFLEVARRHGDYAMMGVAAVVTLDEGGTCTAARLVYLNAGDKPMHAAQASAAIIGHALTEASIAEAAAVAATQEIDPMGSLHASPEFQRHLASVLTKRAVKLAAQRAKA